MDSGDVIVGLDEPWTFLGATLVEWMSGFVMFMIASQLFFTKITQGMPILLVIWIGTTLSMKYGRLAFPDGERGLRNALAVFFGVCPPGLPLPSEMQPIWSGAPLRELGKEAHFTVLNLNEILDSELVNNQANVDRVGPIY